MRKKDSGVGDSAAGPLPKTYFDAVKMIRPYLLPSILKSTSDIRARGVPYPVASDDVFGEEFSACLHRAAEVVIRDFARHFRIPLGEIFRGGKVDYDPMPPRLAQKLQDAIEVTMSAVNLEYFHIANFELCGRNVFRFSDTLVRELSRTNSNVRCEFVHLPYRSCMFVSQSPIAINALHAYLRGDGLPEDPEERQPGVVYEVPLTVFISELDSPGIAHPVLSILMVQGRESGIIGFAKRALLLDPAWNVERALLTDWDAIRGPEAAENMVPGAGSYSTDSGMEAISESELHHADRLFLLRLIVNMALYVTSTDPDLLPGEGARLEKSRYDKLSATEKARRRKLQAASSELAYTEAGARIRPVVIDNDPGQAQPGAGSARGPVKVRFSVRSHWRNQRVGPGRNQVRRLWVREHERGPELADLVNRHYEVRTPRKDEGPDPGAGEGPE